MKWPILAFSNYFGSFFVLCLFGIHSDAHAAAKKAPTQDQSPTYGTPNPTHVTSLAPVETQHFHLPNGIDVDLQAELNSIFTTIVTSDTNFRPSQGAHLDPCGTSIELRAAVTAFELDAFDLGITFGYSPTGSVGNGISSASGSVKVRVGVLAMDFSIWQCKGGECQAIAASRADGHVTGVTGEFEIDFSQMHGAMDFANHPVIQQNFATVMRAGMQALASSTHLSELSWRATVRDYNAQSGTLIFDKGVESRLASNQTFVVYAVTDATGVCNVYRPVADIHTTEVDTVSSLATVDRQIDPRGVQVGDLVMVRPAPVPSPTSSSAQ